ncbi:PIR protein [Plasmodium yoelii yoelii]|uniref:PIR protein n=1 Tax=Plasmodium yoelii yoelii TaxID=73239 RepID=A0AAE9WX90_PLAYO|nr:PIR protein [Plasmodium yoelii yoelii]
MNDEICSNFVVLRSYFPDDLGESPTLDFNKSTSIKKYCPDDKCNTDLEKIMAGFLWSLEQNCSISKKEGYDENNTNVFFLYIISWLSHKLNKNSEHYSTKINDFYNKYVYSNQKYTSLINDDSKCANLKKIIDEKNDLLNINIEDMSNFYDVFKLLCNMYDIVETRADDNTLLNDTTIFVNKYSEINDYYNIENTPYSKILSVLLTDYNNFKTKNANKINNSKQFPDLPTERATKSFLRHSSIKISVIPMTFIFFGLLIYLGIVYKRSSFDFRKRLQRLNLRIKKIKKKINH